MNVDRHPQLCPCWYLYLLKRDQLLVWTPLTNWWGRVHKQRVGPIFGTRIPHIHL